MKLETFEIWRAAMRVAALRKIAGWEDSVALYSRLAELARELESSLARMVVLKGAARGYVLRCPYSRRSKTSSVVPRKRGTSSQQQ